MKKASKSAQRRQKHLGWPGKISRLARRRTAWLLLVGAVVCAVLVGLSLPSPFWDKTAAPREPTSTGPASMSVPPEPTPLPFERSFPPPEPTAIPPEPPAVSPVPSYTPPRTVAALAKEEIEVARRLMEDFPNDPNAIGLMGNVHSKHGNNSAAMECWQKCVQLDPNRVTAYNAMGLVALLNDEYEKAAALWRKTLKLQPKLPSVHFRLAQALVGMGELPEAVAALEKDLEISPTACNSYCLLGQIHSQLKDYEKAKESFQAAIRLRPDLSDAYYGLAMVCARLKQREESQRYMEKFRQRKAEDSQADQQRRNAYDDLGAMRGRAAQTYTHAAGYYFAHGKAKKAEELWRRAAAIDPRNAACRYALASLYEQNGQAEQALSIWEELREIDPANVTCYLKLGSLHAGARRFDAAEKAFAKARQLAPQQSAAYRALAQIYLQTNRNVPQALKLARTAVRLEPTAPNYFVLSVACENNADHYGALAAMKRALALDPDNAKYRHTYERLQQRK